MKLTKTEKTAIVLTLLFLVFTFGVHWGAGRMRDSFSISTQKSTGTEAAEAESISEAPVNTESSVKTPGGMVNINTAGKEELMELDGIGEKLAERIIQYREENGAFGSIQDITRVSGIGSGIYGKICDDITV